MTMNLGPTRYVEKPKDRKGHTFFRLRAFSGEVDTQGAVISSTEIALGKLTIRNLDGKDIVDSIISIRSSSEAADHSLYPKTSALAAIDPDKDGYWKSGNDNINGEWIEIAVKNDDQRISSYTLTAAPEIWNTGNNHSKKPGNSRNLIEWRLERLTAYDYNWRVLNIQHVRKENNFLTVISGNDIPILSDKYDAPVATPGYIPTIDYEGRLPSSPANVRVSAASKSKVIIRWLPSSDLRATTYQVYRKDTIDGDFLLVGTIPPTITTSPSGTKKVKNNTTFTDTTPNTDGGMNYTYKVCSVNEVGTNPHNYPIEVTTLDDNQVYIDAIDAKILAGTPMSIDEIASWLLNDKIKGNNAASLITRGMGTYTEFRKLGYRCGRCSSINSARSSAD